MKCSLCISNFLEEISSLSRFIVFLYFFALTTEEGFLISPCYSLEFRIQIGISFLFFFDFWFSSLSHSIVPLYFFALIAEKGFLISPCYSLELCIQMSISFLFSFVFCLFLFIAICKASSESHFAFLHFFFLEMILLLVSCTTSRTSVHSSSGTLSFRSCPLNLFVTSTVWSLGIWFRSYLNSLVVFPTFFHLNLNLAIWSSLSEPQLAPSLALADCIEFLLLWLQRI